MALRIVVVGGGAAGIGRRRNGTPLDPDASVTVYTEFEDVGYSPCGIPYVHGKEIPKFENLFLQDKAFYKRWAWTSITRSGSTAFDLENAKVIVEGEGDVAYDKLVIATGFNYKDPGVPGTDLEGLYYVKNIRQAMEWDKILDSVKKAVVVEASPLGLEMVTALAHRGIETHLIDPHPWALAEVGDPDIMKPVMDSWTEMGVISHYNTKVEAFLGEGKVRAVTDQRRRARGRPGRDLHPQDPQQQARPGGRAGHRVDRRHHRRPAHGHLQAGRVRRRRLQRAAARHHQDSDPRPFRKPRLRPGQGRRQQRRWAATASTSRSTSRGAWWPASG